MEDSATPPSPNAKPISNEEEKEKKEYKIIYNKETYKVEIIKNIEYIIIRCFEYETKIALNYLSMLVKDLKLDSIDQSFEFLNKIFIQNKVIISEYSNDKMKLTFQYDKEKDLYFELILDKNTPGESSFENKKEKINIYKTPGKSSF